MTHPLSALRPAAVVATLLVASASSALASSVPFDPNNQISFTGFESYNNTSISFTNAGNGTGGATGIFSNFNGATTTFNNFTYSPFSPFTLFNSTALNGSTLSFNVTSLTVNNTAGLDLFGYGTYILNGTTIQNGDFELTTQGAQNSTVSFSDTNSVALAQAPEPASLALLGTGLVGLVGVVRRRLS